ncbi:hypothetical protein LINPERHAP1_LOCUS17734 [Linum perenne]
MQAVSSNNNNSSDHIDQSMNRAGEDDDHQQLQTPPFHDHQNSISSGGGAYLLMQCPYYVQSPISSSAIILKNPTTSEEDTIPLTKDDSVAAARGFTLSRYSSSQGSSTNISFFEEKKIVVNGNDIRDMNGVVIVDGLHRVGLGKGEEYVHKEEEEDEDEDEEEVYNKGSCLSYFSLRRRRRSSCGWILMQLSWRFLVSLGVALLVFYLITNPPPPKLSIKVAGVNEFGLGEGVDTTGVTTKILTVNCSLHLIVDNKSNLFGLHINPPLLQLSFGRLPFAISRGTKLYADSHHSTSFRLYVGTRNKPMYGAGRSMQDFMESGRELPIHVRVKLSSYFSVVWNLIRHRFHHKVECMLFLHKTYDRKRHSQTYHSTCTII